MGPPLAIMSARTFTEVVSLWLSAAVAVVATLLSFVALACRQKGRQVWTALALGLAIVLPILVLLLGHAA